MKDKLYIFANILMGLYGFLLFFSAKESRFVLILIVVLWIVTGDYKEKFQKIYDNKIALSFVVLIGLFIMGMMWTESMEEGGNILKRPLLFLISPLIVSMYRKAFLKYFIFSLIAAIVLTSFITVLIHIGWSEIPYSSKHSPFINRGYLGGMLIFGLIYLLLKIEIKKRLSPLNIILVLSIPMVVFSIIAMEARMVYINMILALGIVLLYKIGLSIKSILITLFSMVVFSLLLYTMSTSVKDSVDRTVKVITHMDIEKQVLNEEVKRRTSLTCRFEFWYYAYALGKKHFPLGVGTGDGILELERSIGKEKTDKLFARCSGHNTGQFNPHNMYLFVFMQFGLLGIVILGWFLYRHLTTALETKSIAYVVLIITTLVAMFSDSILFCSKYYIAFYGYTVTVMYLMWQESQRDKKYASLL